MAARLRTKRAGSSVEGVSARQQRYRSSLTSDHRDKPFSRSTPSLSHTRARNSDPRGDRSGVQCVVLRLRRTCNPDVVAIEHLEHFLRDAEKRGVVVFLAGVRADLGKILRNVRFQERLPAYHIYAKKMKRIRPPSTPFATPINF